MNEKTNSEVSTVKSVHLEGLGMLYPVESVMRILGVSLPTLKSYERRGTISIKKFGGGSYITAQSLGQYFGIDTAPKDHVFKNIKDDLKQLKDTGEKAKIESALNNANWNFSQAARILQISRDTLYRKTKKHGIKTKRSQKKKEAKIPFFLNIKDLMVDLRRQWRKKENAEVTYSFDENQMYKGFTFETCVNVGRKGRKGRGSIKTRWYNWTLIAHNGKNVVLKEPQYELHEAAAELISNLQSFYGVNIFKGDRALYFDPRKNSFTPMTIDSINDSYAWIRLEGEFKEVSTGYFLPLDKSENS